ncbi:MAG: electron transfer flavoprotein subunit beta/FixA family protein [Actinobacteria bacterium]|nr:electron transfer flavoprotein subunit beta/FixA family protein [Actinomycetota bacterium]
MKILVLMKMVPDIVEELEVASDGRSLDQEYLRFIVNERDEYALEQALLLKDGLGATVTVVAPDAPEVDDVLYTARAKGADRLIKVTGLPAGSGARATAAALAVTLPAIEGALPADLVLSGCQAIDDLDGFVAPLLAGALGVPYLGLVSRVSVDAAAGKAQVMKEFAGGVMGRFEVSLPALLGIQGCEKPPRYVPVAKVRAAIGAGGIEAVEASAGTAVAPVEVAALAKPEAAGHAEMLEGSAQDVAEKVADILAARGLL